MQARKVYSTIGLFLIIGSCLLWAAVVVVPFYPSSISQKALITTYLIVISEAMFWLGILLVGKEFAHRFRRKFNPYYWWQKIIRK